MALEMSGRAAAVLLLIVLVGCCHDEGAGGSFDPDEPYDTKDVMRLLRAMPELYGEVGRYEDLAAGPDSISKVRQFDRRAEEHGYSCYMEFIVALNRVTNAVAYIRMLEKAPAQGRIEPGDGTDVNLKRDAELVRPFVADIERARREAEDVHAVNGTGGP